MTTERFLAAEWASVHGPAGGPELLTWALERGFQGLTAGPAPRAVAWEAVARASRDLPARLVAVRHDSALQPRSHDEGSLASRHAGERAGALARLEASIELALRLGCPRVIMEPGIVRVGGERGPDDLGDGSLGWTEDLARAQAARRMPGRDAALDAVCRGLFALLRRHDSVELCLTPGRHVLGLAQPDDLDDVFGDLGHARLSYWHDAAVAARREQLLGTPQGEWLERFGSRMSGITLADAVGGEIYLPPGAGGVDYPLLAADRRRLGRPLPAVVELDLAVESSEIPGIHAFLDKYGL